MTNFTPSTYHSIKPATTRHAIPKTNYSRFVLASLLLCCSYWAQAQSVIRGPYINSNSSNSSVIKWRTEVTTTSKLWYGLSPTNLNNTLTNGATTVDHEFTVNFLNANTKYYYAVGDFNGILEGGTTDYFFKTAPVNGTTPAFKAWILGDMGTGSTEQNEGLFEIRVYTIIGTEVLRMESTGRLTSIAVADWPAGLYVLRISKLGTAESGVLKFEKM